MTEACLNVFRARAVGHITATAADVPTRSYNRKLMHPESDNIEAILLAAGRGTRFGGDKLRHTLADGRAIAVHAAANLRAAGLRVVAVVRPEDAALRKLLEAEGCLTTPCAQAAAGMGHTLAHGVRLAPAARGWVVALGDMPAVRPETIKRVVDALKSGARIAAPAYRGQRGHPVGFAAEYYGDLSALAGDAGARNIMQAHRDALVLLECDDAGVVYDIDTRSDLGRPV